MNRILFYLLLWINFSCFSQTQHQMHKAASEEYQKTDTELNDVYQKILNTYKSDPIFIAKLKKAQRIWISYRDAELEMKFPAKDKQMEYGSAYPMCVSLFLTELTKERTQKLNAWLHGIEEGDMCSGSIRTN